jgi:SAM-dependent methyltransferase
VSAPPDHLTINRSLWNLVNEQFTDADALARWQLPEITWGLFGNLESDVSALGQIKDQDVIELGCGTAYFSGWLAHRGARPVGVDLSPAQLATAARCQRSLGVAFPLLEADASDIALPDSSFDLAVSEYGASVWCEPQRWVAEAARLLRPGGRLVFLTNSPLVSLCVPAEGGAAGDRLLRTPSDVARVHWPEGGVEFHPSHAEWIAVLRTNGFTVQALHELHARPHAVDHTYYEIADTEWATRWPVEDLWVVTKSPEAPD